MITIQRASPAETGLIAPIATKSLVESHGNSAPIEDIELYISRNFSLNALEKELKDQENIFHIIYLNGRAVSYSKIIFNKPNPLIASVAITKLERLYILKDFYDLKLGFHLFEFITGLSKRSNKDGTWLFVWVQNLRALSFYKKSGFEIIGNTDFKISPTHSNPNHIMYLKY